jgi:ABC-type antimicrobial peptide transport system permease subunit
VARALRLIVPGIALGVAGAAVLARALAGMLFGVATLDPVSFIAIPAFLAAVGLLPVLIAARRATRIDPLRLLRAE